MKNYQAKVMKHHNAHSADKVETENALNNEKYYQIKNNCYGKIIDLGCGNGTTTFKFIKDGFKIYSIDFAEKMLLRFRERCKLKKVNTITLARGDLCELPYKAESFNCAVCFSTLYYIKNKEQLINEIYRVLKTRGLVIFDCANNKSMGGAFYVRKYKELPQFFVPHKKLMDLLRSKGFIIINIKYFELIPRINIPIVKRLLDFKLGKKSLDEIISSIPILSSLAFRSIIIAKKLVHSCAEQ